MTPIVNVALIYTQRANVQVHTLHYDNKDSLALTADVNSQWRKLPHEDHYEIIQSASVAATAPDGTTRYEASSTMALIAVVKDVPPEEVPGILTTYLPGILFPYTRQKLASLTTDIGYGVVTLPPIDISMIKPATELTQEASIP